MELSDPEIADRLADTVEAVASEHHVPGIAWAVVAGGEVVLGGGRGSLSIADPDARPDVRSLFRIASMTKSFTAAAVLLLRDEARLRLDDPVGEWVPQWAGLRGPSADAELVTIRHLLTMTSGLATDDPWGDRLLAIGRDELDELLGRGATFAVATGTAYEYSNLGYVALGRVVEAASAMTCQSFVTDRFLAPLGMTDTVWDADDVAPARVARPHRWQDDRWVDDGDPLGDGGFAPMGGLWSTVADLARWVGFWCDGFPARDGDDGAPLRRASRREAQRAWTSFPSRVMVDHPDRWRVFSGGYAMGLQALDDLRLGLTVGHSGGLPGFGSNMRWLPHRGIGVVALGNVTYAPMAQLNHRLLHLLADLDALAPAPPVPVSPALRSAAQQVAGLLGDWDDGLARSVLAVNVALDDPFERRRADAAALVERHGPLTLAGVTAENAAAGVATLVGAVGEVKVDLQLSAEKPPRVQHYDTVAVLPQSESLAAAAAVIAARLAGRPTHGAGLDDEAIGRFERELAAITLLFGVPSLGAVTACDGAHHARFALHTQRGNGVALDLTVDDDGAVTAVSIVPND